MKSRVSIPSLVAIVAGLALSALAASARAETHVPFCSGACVAPSADGTLDAVEYAGAVGAPLANFAAGGPNGTLRLIIAGDRLHVGMRLPSPPPGHKQAGQLLIHLDAARPQTTCLPAAPELPGLEDRLLTIDYDLDRDVASTSQKVGNGIGWQAASGPSWWLKLWPSTFRVRRASSGMIDAELVVTLRPAGAASSAVLADGKLGLALRNQGIGSAEHWPGAAASPPIVDRPCSWELLTFGLPRGVPLALAAWQTNVAYDYGGNAGEPEDIADHVATADVACLTELGSDGERQEVVDWVNDRRFTLGLDPVVQVAAPLLDDAAGGRAAAILSARPVIASGYLDLLNPVLWARVLTKAGDPPVKGAPHRAGEFVDVFCTTSLGDEGLAAAAQYAQATRAPDRPAFFLVTGAPITDERKKIFGIDQPTAYDAATTWLSDAYDLSDLIAPDRDLYRGTHILALPSFAEWPAYGIEADPTASGGFPTLPTGETISEQPLVTAEATLIRTDAPGHWNPARPHRITYQVTRLVDHASGGCCADWFTPFIGFVNGPSNAFANTATPDGDEVIPGWSASAVLGAGSLTATAQVMEHDSGPNDHYDVVPEPGAELDPFFRIDHLTGQVTRVKSNGLQVQLLGTFEQSPGGFALDTTGSTGEVGTASHLVTAEEMN